MGLREYEEGNPVWVFPGGRCDLGESPEECLRREVAEEIGIKDLQALKFLGKKEGVYKDKNGKDEVYIFECTTLGEPVLLEPEKFLKWRWFGVDDLPQNLIDPEDAKLIEVVLLKGSLQ